MVLYECIPCNYSSTLLGNFKRHKNTKKHHHKCVAIEKSSKEDGVVGKMSQNEPKMSQNEPKMSQNEPYSTYGVYHLKGSVLTSSLGKYQDFLNGFQDPPFLPIRFSAAWSVLYFLT